MSACIVAKGFLRFLFEYPCPWKSRVYILICV
jgi:hypothetical protein